MFAVMRGEIEVMDAHPHSAGVHQVLTELCSVPGNGKNLSPVILFSKIED